MYFCNKNVFAAFVSSLVIVGCSGGGGGGVVQNSNQFCEAIATTSSSLACTGCVQVTDNGNVFDGNLDSFAPMSGGGQATFSGNIGNVQPSGRDAGVYFVLPSSSQTSISISTLRNGTVQDTGGPSTISGGNTNCAVLMDCFFTDGAPGFVGLHTTKDYDTIRVTINNSSPGTLQINELCVR